MATCGYLRDGGKSEGWRTTKIGIETERESESKKERKKDRMEEKVETNQDQERERAVEGGAKSENESSKAKATWGWADARSQLEGRMQEVNCKKSTRTRQRVLSSWRIHGWSSDGPLPPNLPQHQGFQAVRTWLEVSEQKCRRN
eukprot:3757026-Rhodomonas_salina.1